MKNVLTTLLILCLFTNLFSQVVPIADSTRLIKTMRLKSISVKFKSISDLKEYNGREVVSITFNQAGQKVHEKYLRLFDVVNYTEEFFYKYGPSGLLIEKIKLWKDPEEATTTKWMYAYNDRGRLNKEFKYLSKDDNEPNLQSTYEYDTKGRTTKVINTHLLAPTANTYLNMSYEYFYNTEGLLEKIKESWTNSSYVTIEHHQYAGRLLVQREKISKGYVQMKTSYEYNANKKVEKEIILNAMINDERTIEYLYKKGFLTGKVEKRKNGEIVKYEYTNLDNGLLTEEFWFDKGKKVFSFVTTYGKW